MDRVRAEYAFRLHARWLSRKHGEDDIEGFRCDKALFIEDWKISKWTHYVMTAGGCLLKDVKVRTVHLFCVVSDIVYTWRIFAWFKVGKGVALK